MQNYYSLLFAFLVFSCKTNPKNEMHNKKQPSLTSITKEIESYKKIVDIPLPEGYVRINSDDSSFGNYLRNIGIKKSSTVYLYNGLEKANQTAQFAVLDVSVGKKDLQQCADAVMRLRAEYLFSLKRYKEIIFIDNEKVVYSFKEPFTRLNLDAYLQKVFGMCGSASLAIQLKRKVDLSIIEIGDVFIRGGFPGHAVIVMDVIENEVGEKAFLLAQSYMPAQDIHVLKNPNNDLLNPWYYVKEIKEHLITPEYTFTRNELKTW